MPPKDQVKRKDISMDSTFEDTGNDKKAPKVNNDKSKVTRPERASSIRPGNSSVDLSKRDEQQKHDNMDSVDLTRMTGHPKMKGDEVQHRGLTCRALFHNIRTYAAVISVTWFLFGLGWGTFVTSISTIEKRFNLQSTQAGMIIGSYEIGHLSFALLISHFGNRFNTPKLVGFSVILLAGFHGLMTLPKFIIDPAPLSLSEGANGTVSESSLLLCRNNSQFSSSLQNSDPCSNIGAEAAATSSEIAFAIFLASFVALGIVGTPINTLAVSYLDDNADSPAQSVLFFGILGCMLSLGPMVGGFMNSEMLSLPEDLQETTLTPDHPAWVGAWWLQKMIEMGLFLIPACLFFFFPRKMVKPGTDDTGTNQTDGRQITNAKQNPAVGRESNKFAPKDYLDNGRKEEETAGENSPMMEKKNMAEVGAESEEVKYTWKSLVTTLHRLLCNPTYIFITLSACCIIYLLGGLFSFLPKYYEKQFGISASRASTIIGVVTGVFGCGGNILGGLISSKFKLNFRSMVVFCVTCLAVAAVATFSAIFIGCESGKLVPSSSTFYQNSSWSCSAPCDCSPDDLDPVCDTSSGVTFLSPCYAGCLAANQTTIGDSAIQDYYQCSCSRSGQVITGFCPRDCSGPLVLFSVAMVILVLFSSMVNAPSVILLLRSVDKADKTLAVGLGTCFISLLGWMPSSTLYGIVIDGTCDVWKSTCGTKGACWHYHGDKFRVRLHGVTFAFVAAAFLFYVGVLYFSKGKFIADDETNERGKMELCCTSKKHDMR